MQKLSAFMMALFLIGCAEFPGVYKVAIEQGNILTQEMIAKLEVGQTKEQVRFILGSPLLEDTFINDRWDYAYRFKGNDGFTKNGNLILLFSDNNLTEFNHDGISQAK